GRTPFALFVSDAEALADREEGGVGSDVLALARLDGGGEEIRLDVGPIGRILHAVPSPDGSKIALSTHDNVVRLVALRGLEDPAREVGRSSGGEVRDLAWSPDGRWLVWAEPNSWQLSRLMISDTDDPEPTGRALTTGKFQDSAPAFSADGKHLALLSLRTFETVYDDMVFDLGFVNAERPFLLPLERTTPGPFGPHPDGWGADAAGDAKDGGGGKETARTDADGGSVAAPHAGGAAQAASEQPATSHSAAGADEAQRPPATRIDLDSVESRL